MTTQILPYRRISVEDKHRLVDAHGRGEDYVQLARQMGIERTTAYAMIRRTQKMVVRLFAHVEVLVPNRCS